MFHRFRMGDMQATIVSDGPLTLDAAPQIFSGVPDAALNAALAAAGKPIDAVRVEQNCLVLALPSDRADAEGDDPTGHAGRYVLFDNGLGSTHLYGPDSGRLLDSLRVAGIDPAAIGALVLTHAHSDHCWGTMGDDEQPNFPNAQIYMAEAELAFWTSDPPGQKRERSIAGVRKHLLPLRDRIRFVRDGAEFLPGVQAWLTPGHTPGHMSFLFAGGWCLTGDVAFQDPISFSYPEAQSAYDVDPVLGANTRREALDRLCADSLRIVGYHQPWPGLGRVERATTAFRYVPDAAV